MRATPKLTYLTLTREREMRKLHICFPREVVFLHFVDVHTLLRVGAVLLLPLFRCYTHIYIFFPIPSKCDNSSERCWGRWWREGCWVEIQRQVEIGRDSVGGSVQCHVIRLPLEVEESRFVSRVEVEKTPLWGAINNKESTVRTY